LYQSTMSKEEGMIKTLLETSNELKAKGYWILEFGGSCIQWEQLIAPSFCASINMN
jgi:hypothetical protein